MPAAHSCSTYTWLKCLWRLPGCSFDIENAHIILHYSCWVSYRQLKSIEMGLFRQSSRLMGNPSLSPIKNLVIHSFTHLGVSPLLGTEAWRKKGNSFLKEDRGYWRIQAVKARWRPLYQVSPECCSHADSVHRMKGCSEMGDIPEEVTSWEMDI